jgi:ATP-dependent helicase HrpA
LSKHDAFLDKGCDKGCDKVARSKSYHSYWLLYVITYLRFIPLMSDGRIEEIRQLLPRAMLPDWVRLGARLVRLLRDHHHADSHNAILARLLDQARASVALRERRFLDVPEVSYPSTLPITSRKEEIVNAIRTHQVVVIAGETGSGKTTQIPKMCLEAGLGIEAKIGCTQPRRIAALSISRRIAEELNVDWGREVGCKIRFDDRSSRETYIKLMTDGILLAETQGDPLLSEYNAIIIDEAHERSLNIDFLLGYLKGLLAKRNDLKLIVTSATIDTEAFSRAFNHAPIIEVSGRLYPVEVIYAPLDAASEERGDMTYIDAAVRATEQVMGEPGPGDVLIFMPGERDIRETRDLLEGRFGGGAEIIPLFGRLSGGEQQRVFAASSQRKLIIATNIAETSLTIPGIRYVIDSGLARISRYNPRTRIKRLPVEPVSQSSANQRKGRSGRVQNGICIRLYSEEDFAARQPYTQPEIQRANLAEVILRMKAFGLGEIETFPFLNPPSPAAIQAGYHLLQELGAVNEARELTPLGLDLARLPIDPTLGRMLLQSQREHATRELLIIAAGLSIQDPRERPLDQKDAAAAAHQRFVAPESDFLTLLNIWNAVHEQWERLTTQNQRRKFCKAHFLSYLRMREWQDLHAQLHDALEELGALRLNESNAAYDAIHRSILAGLLGHVATRTERNLYKGAGNRQLAIFPGSALHEKATKPDKSTRGRPAGDGGSPAANSAREAAPLLPGRKPIAPGQPEWIMAGEMVETSQLFARTVAGIEPMWLVELAPHLCKVTHHDPHWDAAAGKVLVEERITLYGLEVHRRQAAYGNIDPKAATELFIRSALVEGELMAAAPPLPAGRHNPKTGPDESRFRPAAPSPTRYRFLAHNEQVRHKIETWQTRTRRHDLGDVDQALFEFYAGRLENVSSLDDLNRLLREHTEPGFLCATEAGLTGGQELTFDAEAFPDTVPLGGQPVSLSYAYKPGEEPDGVTLKLGFDLAQHVAPASVEWAVPGLREGQISELLRSLPKAIRKELMPFPPKVAEIVRELCPSSHSLKHDLAKYIHQHYGVEIPMSAWPADALPQHLRPRIEVVSTDQKTLGSGRDLLQLRAALQQVKIAPAAVDPAWAQTAQRWERFGITAWSFGDLPERITVNETLAEPLYAWPGLQVEDDQVNLRLFRSQEGARRASVAGFRRLVSIALQKDLGWLQKDLRALSRLEPLLGTLCSAEELQAMAFENLKRHLLPAAPPAVLTAGCFEAAAESARRRLPGSAAQLIERVESILKLRQEVLRRCVPPTKATTGRPRTLSALTQLGAQPAQAVQAKPAVALAAELETLLSKSFLEDIRFEQLAQIPRYLKAMLTRAERAALNPLKDRERAAQVAPYQEALRKLKSMPPDDEGARTRIEEFRWMLEEFKVSVFAQELGTAMPISAQRLEQQIHAIKTG